MMANRTEERAKILDETILTLRARHDAERTVIAQLQADPAYSTEVAQRHFERAMLYCGALAKWDRECSSTQCGINGSSLATSDQVRDTYQSRMYWRKLFRSYRESYISGKNLPDRPAFRDALRKTYWRYLGNWESAVTGVELTLEDTPRNQRINERATLHVRVLREPALVLACAAASCWCEEYRQRSETGHGRRGWKHTVWANAATHWTQTYTRTFFTQRANHSWAWTPQVPLPREWAREYDETGA